MWTSKHGHGMISPGDLVRSEPGAHCYYTTGDRPGMAVMIQSYATRAKAKLKYQTLYAYTPKGEPITLLCVTVIETGQPRKKRGRP